MQVLLLESGIVALPTSSVIGGHKHRAEFLIYQACQLLLADQGVEDWNL